MDLSTAGTLITIIVGVPTILSWLWKFLRHLRDQYRRVSQTAEETNREAQKLASAATNTEKRADIYFYLLLEHIEQRSILVRMENRVAVMTLLLFIVSGLAAALIGPQLKSGALSENPIRLIAAVLACLFSIGGAASLIMMLWLQSKVSKLANSWESGVRTAIQDKLRKHSPELGSQKPGDL
jgi:hypothetical protein